jgi:hypothetical protein
MSIHLVRSALGDCAIARASFEFCNVIAGEVTKVSLAALYSPLHKFEPDWFSDGRGHDDHGKQRRQTGRRLQVDPRELNCRL